MYIYKYVYVCEDGKNRDKENVPETNCDKEERNNN